MGHNKNKNKILQVIFLAFAENKENIMPSMTFRIIFFFRPPNFQPTFVIYYVNNVGATLVLLRFARKWSPQHKKDECTYALNYDK